MAPKKLDGIRRITVGGLVLIAAATLVLVAARSRGGFADAGRLSHSERIARGAYLVTIGGCNDCHTPWIEGPEGPEPDMTRMLSGHPHDFPVDASITVGEGGWGMLAAETNTAFAGPWGVSFAANLSPDELTGTGAWTEEIFINTLRTGRHWGQGRPILPPMPWFNYGQMTDDDLKSVFAYLRSIPAHRNPVPLPLPPGGVAESEDGWN